jgi:AraC-like DNA-binding protein
MRPMSGATWSFSTARLPPSERATALYDLRERGILPLEPLPGRFTQAEFTKWSLPGISVLSGTLGGLRQSGAPPDAGVSDDMLLGVNLVGESTVYHFGREIRLRSGDAVLFSCRETGITAYRPQPVNFLGLRLPHKDLAPLVTYLDDVVIRLIPGETGSLRLLTTYLRCLSAWHGPDSPDLGLAVVRHIHDLIALSIGAARDMIAVAQGRGIPAARLQAVKADIARNLADRGLTVAAVAARHGVTPRYVHKLFASEGVTFSEFVLDRRLSFAHRLLTDHRSAHRPVTSVALEAGFGDLSYFNRTFRRRYNATPTDVRSHAGG